jgi:hypothetical protein
MGSQFYERTALSKNKATMLRKGQQTPYDVVTPEEEINPDGRCCREECDEVGRLCGQLPPILLAQLSRLIVQRRAHGVERATSGRSSRISGGQPIAALRIPDV